jgi:hypothetical protein
VPHSALVPVIRNELLYASRVDIVKNIYSIGLSNIPLSQKRQISLNFLIGRWTYHTHIDTDDFIESLMISAQFDWDIIIISD